MSHNEPSTQPELRLTLRGKVVAGFAGLAVLTGAGITVGPSAVNRIKEYGFLPGTHTTRIQEQGPAAVERQQLDQNMIGQGDNLGRGTAIPLSPTSISPSPEVTNSPQQATDQ